MDSTTVVAIAGIAGTLFAPLLAEQMCRRSVRAEQRNAHRLEVYADLLRAATRFVDNAMFWSSAPLADLPEIDDEELNTMFARARVVSSDEVRGCLLELVSCATEFNRLLVMEVRPHHERLRSEGKVDDAAAIQQRLNIGKIAERAEKVFHRLEAAMRKEWR